MGEKTDVVITSISAPAIRALTKAIAAALPQQGTPAAPVPDDPYEGVTPWTRDAQGATGGRDVVAFLDDARALRWVPAADIADVPAGWRPLLVGPPVLPKSERL
jgi:hypothetical protein